MKTITTLLIDIGGVCLSNGWDHISREKASIQFSLDYKEFEKRHKTVFKKLEKGKI
jgi:putative hydrolase of the HAD superfamily